MGGMRPFIIRRAPRGSRDLVCWLTNDPLHREGPQKRRKYIPVTDFDFFASFEKGANRLLKGGDFMTLCGRYAFRDVILTHRAIRHWGEGLSHLKPDASVAGCWA
jgi:hypothetical protein